MSNIRNFALGVTALVTLAATVGCGQTGVNNVLPTTGVRSSIPTVNVMGVSRKLGYNVTKADHLTHHFTHIRRQAMLPSAVDNRQFCAPVYDQGQLGSCTAFAMAKGLREYQERKNGEATTPLSALFMYYEERKLEGSVNEDSGATMADGMKVLNTVGAADDTAWPYNISKFTQKPPAAAYATAGARKIAEVTEVANLDEAKAAIANGNAVALGFVVYRSFMNIGNDGVMPNPKPGERILGGHAVLAVGYDDAKQQLIVRNSWSTSWGDKGYFYMPYDFAKGSIAGQQNVMEWFTSSK